MACQRNILVTGATGKQGRACIAALLAGPPASPAVSDLKVRYHVWALTRNPGSAAARRLKEPFWDDLTLVEGDLDDAVGMRDVFHRIRCWHGGLWGVFAVLPYPGLGRDASGEQRQGRMLAELALVCDVSVFLYSSSIPPGPREDDFADNSHLAKRHIEDYCVLLGERGLNWIILRPGFFMENFEGFQGSVAVSVFNKMLPQDTTVSLVATEDIGVVAACVLRRPEPHMHKKLSLSAEEVTLAQIQVSYESALGKAMPTAPLIANILCWLHPTGLNGVMWEVRRNHEVRLQGLDIDYESGIARAHSLAKLHTFYEWKLKARRSKPRHGALQNIVHIWSTMKGYGGP